VKLLIDTHLLLWAAIQPKRLTSKARKMMTDPQNELVFSSASIWEITIKSGLDRGDFNIDPRRFKRGLLDNDYRELTVTSDHALAVGSLPFLHKDPFDRMLVAQATVEGILLLTSDPLVGAYPGPVQLL
jgi:PIN domain nuclease of toxin-antitoxin system